jgi:hypothetical protein
MDPRDVNRINYNNYYVGQNLDFLIRSKMRSESLSTPLTNTPVFYDDQVSSKMALLGKRGFYDPGYIYGFNNNLNLNKSNNINNQPENYANQRDQIIRKDIDEREYNNLNNKYNEDIVNKNDYMKNKGIPNYNRNKNEEEFQNEYYNYMNKMKEMNEQDYNINKNDNNINLPKTKEQIQHEIFLENYKKQKLAQEMLREEEMKYKQNLFK